MTPEDFKTALENNGFVAANGMPFLFYKTGPNGWPYFTATTLTAPIIHVQLNRETPPESLPVDSIDDVATILKKFDHAL